jgi:hypothetical protein
VVPPKPLDTPVPVESPAPAEPVARATRDPPARDTAGNGPRAGVRGVAAAHRFSHCFEDVAVTPDGTVLVGWIDTRDGPGGTATYVAGVAERGLLDRVATSTVVRPACAAASVSWPAG